MILRYKGTFHKIINVRSSGDNNWTFESNSVNSSGLKGFVERSVNQRGFRRDLSR
jgi:hypothetical protein